MNDVLKYTVDYSIRTKTVTGLDADTEYTFRVEAGDAHGNWSDDGPEVDVTTRESSDTTKPHWDDESLTATSITDTSVTLKWLGAEDNEAVTQYRIYVNGNLRTTIDDGDVYTKTITGLNDGTYYTFKIQAGDEAGNWSTDGPSIAIYTQN
jgi:chitodextrinase